MAMATKVASFKIAQRAKTKGKIVVDLGSNVQYRDLNDELFKSIEVIIKEKRDRIADEIFRSEQSYVRSLNLLYMHFKKPLHEMMISNQLPITEQQFATLFANLEDLINVNTELLKRLKERITEWSDKQRLGDVLLTLAPFLLLYTQYSLNYGKAADILGALTQDKKLKQYLADKATDVICNGLDFSSYLIMPIQRIPRYRLLLEEFLQNTPKDHIDYHLLEEALFKIKSVAQDVDKAIVEQENREKMLKICKQFLDYKEVELLQPGRTFVYDGELTKVCRKENKKRHFFLFSDALVYAHPPVAPNTKYKVEQEFKLVFIRADPYRPENNRSDEDDDKKFMIKSEKKSFVVLAESNKIRTEWIEKIEMAQKQLKEKTKSFAASKDSGHIKKEQVEVASTAPVWVPDHSAKNCTLCNSKWTTFNRRHHCRQCGGVVCQNCSSQKKTIQGQGKVRVCNKCFKKPVDPEVTGSIRVNPEDSDSEESGLLDVIYELEAQYDYEPENTDQKLQFKKGDRISILQVDDSGWWLAELNGARGWVPALFLEQPIQ